MSPSIAKFAVSRYIISNLKLLYHKRVALSLTQLVEFRNSG